MQSVLRLAEAINTLVLVLRNRSKTVRCSLRSCGIYVSGVLLVTYYKLLNLSCRFLGRLCDGLRCSFSSRVVPLC